MRTKIFHFFVVIATSIIVGCNDNIFVDHNQSVNILTLNMQMPTDGSTRVALSEADGTKDLLASWQTDDEVLIIIRQGSNVYNIGRFQVANISQDGKSASLNMEIPGKIAKDKPFIIYGFIGINGSVEDFGNGRWVPCCRIDITRSLKSKLRAPMFGMVETNANQSVKLTFQHIATYEVLHLKNKSAQAISVVHCGFETDKPWYRGEAGVNIDSSYDYTKISGEWEGDSESPELQNIPSGVEGVFLSCYMPSGYKMENARLVTRINKKVVKSSNLKSSNVSILPAHAYHMYAEWDGKELRFVDGIDNQHGSALESETITIPGTNVSFKMIAVEGGTFMMGAADDDSDAYSDEKPRHKVTLNSFAIGETEVTQALWEAVMGSNPSSNRGPNLPVEQVSRDDCKVFLNKLNQLTGKHFRLPTEAEWEYAASGGRSSKGYKYAGSDIINDVAWYDNNSDGITHQVAQKQANELGLYDMSGNVWELCQDYWDSNYYSKSPENNPCNTTPSSAYVMRGGAIGNIRRFCRVSFRADQVLLENNIPVDSNWDIGFRLVMSDNDTHTPQSYLTCPDDHHPHMIDLGLPSGTKWACCNVDTDHPENQSPENYGGYYAWGETEEKSTYYWNTYTHCDGSSSTCHDLGSDIAGTQYDVAHVQWGGSWVMPSLDQIEELLDNCPFEWMTFNGVNGRRFIGNNGGIIFLPAAGYRYWSKLANAGSEGDYWSSTQNPSDSCDACELRFFGDTEYGGYYGRWVGQSVRPVSR